MISRRTWSSLTSPYWEQRCRISSSGTEIGTFLKITLVATLVTTVVLTLCRLNSRGSTVLALPSFAPPLSSSSLVSYLPPVERSSSRQSAGSISRKSKMSSPTSDMERLCGLSLGSSELMIFWMVMRMRIFEDESLIICS